MIPETRRIIVSALTLLALAPLTAGAADLPAFRPGIWEYERLVGGSKFVARECVDPTQEMRSHNASLEKLGCRFSPLSQEGSTYTYSGECAMKLPSGASSWSTTSTLTVESETAYRLEVRETNQGKTSAQTVVAHRVDDCK